MKGVMSFLERAGLVTQEPDAAAALDSAPVEAVPVEPVPAPTPTPVIEAAPVAATSGTLNFADIYAEAGVPGALYPAERLLRLVAGLSAMDEKTRQLAIQAMDAADESWTIADPLRDAALKLQALSAYGERRRQELQQFEAETQARLESLRARQEQRVGEIRKQMAELESLLTRELTRGEQECAAQQANLATARDTVARELAELAQASAALQSLSRQFGAPGNPTTQE